jgi:hypothetical protein
MIVVNHVGVRMKSEVRGVRVRDEVEVETAGVLIVIGACLPN